MEVIIQRFYLFYILRYNIDQQIEHLPIILTMEDKLSFPNLLSTLQVYFPLSAPPASRITSRFSFMMEIFSPATSGTPSFCQATAGVGTPLAGHLMVMVVFEAAVTLSPMFIVTGLPSPTGISCSGSGSLITGLMGSV